MSLEEILQFHQNLLTANAEEDKLDALGNIVFCLESGHVIPLLEYEHGVSLIDDIKAFLLQYPSNLDIKYDAAECFWYLSRGSKFKSYLGSESLGLIPFIIQALYESFQNMNNYNRYIHKFCLHLLSNLMLEPSCHSYLLSPEFSFLEQIKQVSPSQSASYRLCLTLLSNLVYRLQSIDILNRILESKIHEWVIRQLMSTIPNPATWKGPSSSSSWALAMLMDLSYYEKAAQFMEKDDQFKAFLGQLVVCPSRGDALKACFILAFLDGHGQSQDPTKMEEKVLLPSNPRILCHIIDVLDATLHCRRGSCTLIEGYEFSHFSMKTCIGALSILATHHLSRSLMVKSQVLLKLVIRTLRLYALNSPPLTAWIEISSETAGGGGEDVVVAESSIKLLSELCSYFDDEILLKKYLKSSVHEVKQTLIQILAIRDSSRMISERHRCYVSTLLKRVDNVSK